MSPVPASSVHPLRERRLASKIRGSALAHALGISAPYLWDLEHGNRPFSEKLLARYERHLTRFEKKAGAA